MHKQSPQHYFVSLPSTSLWDVYSNSMYPSITMCIHSLSYRFTCSTFGLLILSTRMINECMCVCACVSGGGLCACVWLCVCVCVCACPSLHAPPSRMSDCDMSAPACSCVCLKCSKITPGCTAWGSARVCFYYCYIYEHASVLTFYCPVLSVDCCSAYLRFIATFLCKLAPSACTARW